MGGSITTGDFDGDGRPDLYVVYPAGANSLLRNRGEGVFEDVTAKAGAPGYEGSLSATFADYDRSGRPSLFVTGASGIALYRNNGNGTFSDVTRKAGLQTNPGELCTQAVLADVNGDGLPDLLVTVYTDLNHPPAQPGFTFPNDFSGAETRLYRNNGDGSFTEMTKASGIAGSIGRARHALVADFNADGRPDLLLLRDDRPPALYINRGNFSFEDGTWKAGEALTRHAFFDGAVADFNQDGKPDVALWSTMSFKVLLNTGKAVFSLADTLPFLPQFDNPFGFHGVVADLDGDGRPDILNVDVEGRWRAVINQGGRFLEIPFLIKPASGGTTPASAVYPAKLDMKDNIRLLSLHPDSRITALDRVGGNP